MDNNMIEFIIKMKDLMSGGLVKMAKTAQDTMAKVKSVTDKVPKSVENIGKTTQQTAKVVSMNGQKIRREFEDIEKSARKTSETINKGNNGSTGGGFFSLGGIFGKGGNGSRTGGGFSALGGMLGKAAGVLGIALSAGTAIGFAGDSVKAAMNYGATSKSFEVLTGNRQKGTALAGTLNKLQQDTILGPEVFKSAQTLMSFGVSADKVVKIEKQLGDVSMGNKEKFDALTLAFSQTQAAGRLMGQDLLQYINAGFNPLQTMSEHWKEFGLTSKKSVGELKEMMEKGQISAAAVAKAFEVATSSGGKFNNMMDQIGDTSYGKMQVLQGQWESFKIGLGNALMPAAESLMDMANKTLDWLDISKTAPAVVEDERQSIGTLVYTITSLNEKNALRKTLLEQLISKYPEFFGQLDIEHTKNSTLLSLLDKVNVAYEKRYALASAVFEQDKNQKALNEDQKELERNSNIYNAIKNNNWSYANSQMHWYEKDPLDAFYSDATVKKRLLSKFQSHTLYYQDKVDSDQKALDQSTRSQKNAQYAIDKSNFSSSYGLTLLHWARSQSAKSIGSKRYDELTHLLGQWRGNNGSMADWYKLQALRESPLNVGTDSQLITAGATDKKGKKRRGRHGSEVDGITSGGPRVININGVKFADRIEFHTEKGESVAELSERKLQEMFLRILNSGSTIQG